MFWGVLGTLNFWVQGGAKNFGRVIWGGRNFFDLVIVLSMFLKHSSFMFCGYFGQRGAKNFGRIAKGGGRKYLDASRRGGAKNLVVSLGGANIFLF